MAQPDDDIDSLLSRYDPPVEALARELLALVRAVRPGFSVRVAFGWATINFHHRNGFISAIYLRGNRVSLVFQDGRLLDSPLLVDDGKVKKVRWIPFSPGDTLPVDDIAILYAEAVALRG
ncbi:MAG: DUF1801 domain-containing protein [Devosia sp.]